LLRRQCDTFSQLYNAPMEKIKDVEIISVTPELWEVYRDIRLDALQCEPQAFGSSHSRELAFTKEQWMERIANRYNTIVIEDGKAIGTMGAYISNDEIGKIANIVGVYVLGKARGRGLGTKLFDFVLAKVKEDQEIKKLALTVNKEQEFAVALYKKFGFKTVGEETTLMGDGIEHVELLMERKA